MTRLCVGCGSSVDVAETVRLVVEGDEVVFDLAGGSFGRGAHVHPREACLAGAPRGLSRAFKREIRISPAELGRRLVEACDRRMCGLLLAARRTKVLAMGVDEALGALKDGAPLVIVAADAGSVASSLEVQGAVREGRAVVWKTKHDLGVVLGGQGVALCAVRHAGIAGQLKNLRTAADAGAGTMREGAGWSSTYPEAR